MLYLDSDYSFVSNIRYEFTLYYIYLFHTSIYFKSTFIHAKPLKQIFTMLKLHNIEIIVLQMISIRIQDDCEHLG